VLFRSPRYVITTADKTKQLHVGSLCPKRNVERCEERLPPHGEFVFRVIGKDLPVENRWKFCGVEGFVGQELQFEMKKGKCVPVAVTNAITFCSLVTSVTVGGTLTLFGVSTDLTEVDSKVLENEISSMLVATSGVTIDSWALKNGNVEISFEAVVVAERLNVDGRFHENVDTMFSSLQTNVEKSLSSGAFLSQMNALLSGYPRSMASITATSGASLTSFEILNIEYIEAASASADRTPHAIPQAPEVTTVTTAVTVASAKEEDTPSMIITAGGIIAAVVIVAAIALRVRKSEETHVELATDSEHAADSIPEFDLGLEPANHMPKSRFSMSKERF